MWALLGMSAHVISCMVRAVATGVCRPMKKTYLHIHLCVRGSIAIRSFMLFFFQRHQQCRFCEIS